MANPIKGDVQFEAGGRSYTFRLGINAQVLIEARVGMTVQRYIKEKGDDMGATEIRLLFYAGLLQHHKDITEEAAGEIIDEIGPQTAANIFIEAAMLATPRQEDAPGTARPTSSANGRPIGTSS